MKKYLLLAVLGYLSVYNPVHAQLEKGTGYLGATIGISGSNNSQTSLSNSKYSNARLGITPSLSLGKFLKDNFLLGINVGTGIDVSTIKHNDQKTNINNMSYYISPFIRNYKTIGNKSKWAVFLTSSADFALSKHKNKSIFTTTKTSGFSSGLSVKPGIAYWITPRFSLESDINLLSLEAGYSSFEESNSFYLRSGITSSLNGYFSVRAAWYIQKR
jgi:hypothetical protein